MTTMQLVEQHLIEQSNPRWAEIDAACFLSKNLYNAANYIVRQTYFLTGHIIGYGKLDKLMHDNPDYMALPRKVSQQVLMQVMADWASFRAARAEYKREPAKFTGRPALPGYKDKTQGRNLLVYTDQAISRRALDQKGVIVPSGLGIEVPTRQKAVDQVRIVPRKTHYVVEIVYTVEVQPAPLDDTLMAGIDLGVDTLAAVTSNQPGFVPLLVNGRPLKNINHYYNQQRALWQSLLAQVDQPDLRYRLDQITDKRNRKVKHELHVASRRIIDLLVAAGIGVLVIGKNQGWKQKVNLGQRTNQNFVCIPHAQFIDMLTYKAQLAGMQVILIEESYTSKCSFLDLEPLQHHDHYLGQRIERGLFRASDGRLINADVNGAYNILRKAAPAAWTREGVERAVVHASTLHYIT